MRRALLTAALLVCGTACQPTVTSSAQSCAGPALEVSPLTARAGEDVEVSGTRFESDCYDTGQPGSPPPLTDLTLTIVQGERAWTVARGVAATGGLASFRLTVAVPAQLNAGRAELRIGDVSSVALLIVD